MTKRVNISSGSIFEKSYGYSRCVRVGDTVYISGTVGINYQTGECDPNPANQLRQIIRNLEPSLEKAGTSLKDIVQVNLYVSSKEVFEVVAPMMGEIFGDIRPTNASLVVQFPVPGALLEISATAVIGCGA